MVQKRNLVISGTCSVETACNVPYLLAEQHLDVSVNVFKLGPPFDATRAEVLKDLRKSLSHHGCLFGGDDVLSTKHPDVGNRTGNIMLV